MPSVLRHRLAECQSSNELPLGRLDHHEVCEGCGNQEREIGNRQPRKPEKPGERCRRQHGTDGDDHERGHRQRDAQLHAELLAYSRLHSLFAGIDLSGGVLRPDTEVDARAYGSAIPPRNIVDGTKRVAVPLAAQAFVNALARDVRGTSGRK
jgi:hypothetical protein